MLNTGAAGVVGWVHFLPTTESLPISLIRSPAVRPVVPLGKRTRSVALVNVNVWVVPLLAAA